MNHFQKNLQINSSITISHHGAVNGVTGSCHQLHLDLNHSLLIDCGLFQGAETAGEGGAEQLSIAFDISTVQALLVTHCHIDHVGRIPYLLAAGFSGPIIASEATAALLPLVIEDALKVGVTRNTTMINACLKRLKMQLLAVPYKKWHSINLAGQTAEPMQVKVKFQPAGHILGSAYIEVDVNKQATGISKTHSQRVVFSGDLGAPYAPLLAAPKSPYKADILVIESTYGDKIHQARKQRTARLTEVLKRAISDNGVVIIPAFSIGRTQELLYELEQIIKRAKFGASFSDSQLATIEVIVDSPMAAKFTQYYRQFKKFWDAEARQRLVNGRHPLSFAELYTVDSHQEHLATVDYLASRNKPAIVIAASGMCSGGRVVNYLKRFLADKTADVIFVGYQAKGTPGRLIEKYGTRGNDNAYVVLDGKRIDINAGIHSLSGYSAHADQANLVNFVKRMRIKPKQVILVHGDEHAKQALAVKLAPLVEKVSIGV